jgi:threonine dehydrogenase-like Zn-dependent dehydrogenase
MRAALLLSPKKIVIDQVAVPQVQSGEVLIQPVRAGICGSDVSLYLGSRAAEYPLLLGHEVLGRVITLGDGETRFRTEQRVIVEPNYPCGHCAFCRSGRGNICPNKKSLGVNIPGCFSESFVAPAEFVWAIPDMISDEDAVTIEPLAIALHALWQSGVQIGDTIAVIGCGATGLLAIHAAVAQGVRVIAHDKFADKLEMAREMGAFVEERADKFPETCEVSSVTTVFECAGAGATVELALRAVPRGGQVILVGLSSSAASFVPLDLVRRGIRVSGSIIYDHPHDFSRAIELVARGTLRPGRIVTDTLPFFETARALEMACTGQSGKIHLQM